MKINRHNYEEFFMLYWDNELDPLMKKEVEEFVEDHPDLAVEFRLVGNARFTPDKNVVFEGKESLVPGTVDMNNYPEFLISYIDNELDDAEKSAVLNFVAAHPQVAKELELLQKTKIQPDHDIVFPDKSVLYRTPEKVRIVSMRWFRIAAAAVLLLISGYVLLRLSGPVSPTEDPGMAVLNNQPVTSTPADTKTATTPQNAIPSTSDNIPETQIAAAGLQDKKKNTVKTPVRSVNNVQQEQQLPEKNISPEAVAVESQLPERTDVAFEQNRVRPEYTFQTEDEERKSRFFSDNNVTEKTTPTYAIYNPVEESDDNGGFRELFRKATRLFERRTKIQTTTEDNKLLVGAFAVSLK